MMEILEINFIQCVPSHMHTRAKLRTKIASLTAASYFQANFSVVFFYNHRKRVNFYKLQFFLMRK